MILANSKKSASEVSNFTEPIFIVRVSKDYFFFGLGAGLFSKSVRTTRTSQTAIRVTYSVTDPINKRSTALRPVAPIIIKSMVQNRQGTFIMTMMTASGERTAQTVAMNDLGQALYRAILEQ
ncbi:hypothetical protein WP50_17085 [Lactiplantibacillus plantarum]|nr:hypothetical protein WP50_17085 [Lactiplantibacillus plantarum]